jgi:hypothetical protein
MCVAEWEHSRGRSYDIKACRPQRHLAGGVGWVGSTTRVVIGILQRPLRYQLSGKGELEHPTALYNEASSKAPLLGVTREQAPRHTTGGRKHCRLYAKPGGGMALEGQGGE